MSFAIPEDFDVNDIIFIMATFIPMDINYSECSAVLGSLGPYNCMANTNSKPLFSPLHINM